MNRALRYLFLFLRSWGFRLRLKMKLKRFLFYLLGLRLNRTESLERRESDVIQDFVELAIYSDLQTLGIADPRNGNPKLHVFDQRKVFEVFDIILEPRQGLIFTKSGNFIEQSSNWDPHENFLSFPWHPKDRGMQVINNPKSICLSSQSFWHWLVEDLPSVIYLINKFPDSEVLIANDSPKYVQDFLQISGSKYRVCDGPVFVKSLVFVGKGSDSGWPHPSDLEILRNFPPFKAARFNSPTKRVYISRRASKRSPQNEDQVERLFARYGFQIVKTEELNLIDEVTLISQANVLAGVHGAGLANMVWMSPNSLLIDIVNTNYWTESNHRAASLLDLAYIPIVYKGKLEGPIDLQHVVEILDRL